MQSFRRQMRSLQARCTRRGVLFAIFALLVLSACSGVTMVYHRLDWWVERYVDDFVDFTTVQEKQFQRAFNRVHIRHCREDLPQYSAWLAEIAERARSGRLTPDYLKDLRTTVRVEWDRLLVQAAPDAIAVLESLSVDQVAQLEKGFEQANADYQRRRGDTAEDALKERRRMMMKRIEYWFGEVTPTQTQRVEQWAVNWRADEQLALQARQRWQRQLIILLQGRMNSEVSHADLYLWFVGYRDYRSTEYQAVRDHNEALTLSLAADLSASISPKQLSHFNEELEVWQNRIAAVDCARVERPL